MTKLFKYSLSNIQSFSFMGMVLILMLQIVLKKIN